MMVVIWRRKREKERERMEGMARLFGRGVEKEAVAAREGTVLGMKGVDPIHRVRRERSLCYFRIASG